MFKHGVVFSPCPEGEAAAPGDPRHTGDIQGHRDFLIKEYQLTREAFRQADKDVRSNFHPMNGDVALAIMDQPTTQALGGLVVIDHYVLSPEKLAQDIKAIAAQSGGQVILGEFGAPIPDIHGSLSPIEQAAWVNQALTQLAPLPELVGVNYWVNVGGSTQIWDISGAPRPAVSVLSSFFRPSQVRGLVTDQFSRPIAQAQVSSEDKTVYTNSQGQFTLPYLFSSPQLTVSAAGFADQTLTSVSPSLQVTLTRAKSNLWLDFLTLLHRLFKF